MVKAAVRAQNFAERRFSLSRRFSVALRTLTWLRERVLEYTAWGQANRRRGWCGASETLGSTDAPLLFTPTEILHFQHSSNRQVRGCVS